MICAILVTGDRNWTDKELIKSTLNKYNIDYNANILIHGACSGVDIIAGAIGKELGFEIYEYPVTKQEWKERGLIAGPMRNRAMINKLLEYKDTHKIITIAFHDDIENSKGTKNCVKQAIKQNIEVEYVTH